MLTRLFPLVAVVLLASVVLGPAAAAQDGTASQSDLRRENERLRTQADDLRRELAAARAEIKRLQDQMAALVASGAVPTPAPVEPAVTVDESKPDASPRALLAALRASHAETLGEVDRGTGPQDRARIAYLRQLERWVATVNREHRVPVQWHVRVTEANDPAPAGPDGKGGTIRLQAVDPQTDAVLGDQFVARLPRLLFARLRNLRMKVGLESVMILKGTLVPNVRIDPERETEGPFERPRFLGPWTVLEFHVDAQSLVTKPKAEPKSNSRGGVGSTSG